MLTIVGVKLTSSRPVWGAWIEINGIGFAFAYTLSRAPYGARGLKFGVVLSAILSILSRPVWGAWIEMVKKALVKVHF